MGLGLHGPGNSGYTFPGNPSPTPSPLGSQIGGGPGNIGSRGWPGGPTVIPPGDGATSTGNLGAGQGPVPGTGQIGVDRNPFNNTFNWNIPSYQPSSDGTGTNPSTASGSSTGVTQYVPVIIVGVIIAGLGYYLFERKRK